MVNRHLWMLGLGLGACSDGGSGGKGDRDCAEVAWYVDLDADSFGDSQRAVSACEAPDGYVAIGMDCNDGDPKTHPSADEQCNDIDDDCDGSVDEGKPEWFVDGDGDGVGGESTALACQPGPGLAETTGDCDDTNASISPLASEQCDGLDQDCDGVIDEGTEVLSRPDADGDGYGDSTAADVWACEGAAGFALNHLDCDDTLSDVFPGAPERCDGADQDCDNAIDEGVTTPQFLDADGDGKGDPLERIDACPGMPDRVTDASDCDDTEPAAYAGATEICDGIDNNCDNRVDEGVTTTWYTDGDGDGFGDPLTETTGCAAPPEGITFVGADCNDADATIFQYAVERCNGIDEDCDGTADDGLLVAWWYDADGDGYGDDTLPQRSCVAELGSVARGGDCDDADITANIAALEACDGADDDCDGFVDDTVSDLFWPDEDGDGFGATELPFVRACTQPDGWAAQGGDCDDSDDTLDGITCLVDLPGTWSTFGGDNARSGHAQGFVGGGGPTERWRLTLDGQSFEPPAISDGLVLLTSNRWSGVDKVLARDLETGAEVWAFSLADSAYPASPATSAGRVYVAKINSSDSQLFAISAASGTELWRKPIGAQWELYPAPLVMDGQVFLAGGTYGGLYAFDAISGAQQWFVDGPQIQGWTPVGADGVVYRQVEHDLFGHSPATGAVTLEVALPGESFSWYTMSTVPALGDGAAFLIDDEDLLRVDTATGTIDWVIESGFSGSPTVSNGLVYAIRDGVVVQVDAVGADVIRVFSDPGILHKIVVTDDVVFAASGTATWMYDLSTGTELAEIPEGGVLAVAEDSLVITHDTTVIVYDL